MSDETVVKEGPKENPPSPSTSDEEDEGQESDVRLSWRMDPDESLSDWTIEIWVGGKTHGTYHVHKSTISVGSGRSEYFARLFANKGSMEHETQTSRIEMEEAAANAFPLMLDFLYLLWDNNQKPITAENAVPLHHLGNYFEIRSLRKEARIFWKNAMTVAEAGTYLEHANIFHDDKAYQAVVKKCSRSFRSIMVDSRLMEVSDANFWLALLKENKSEPNPALSILISSFCSKNKEGLDPKTFLNLTEKSVLPELSVSAALELLQLEQLFTVSTDELSNLQERSLEALLSCQNDDQELFGDLQLRLKTLPPLVLSQLAERSLGKLWNCNRKLEVMTHCVPTAIIVAGAGIDAVNGVYSLASKLREKAPRFVKRGSWEGSLATFELYRTRGGEKGFTWYISILKGALPNDFYYASLTTGAPWLPPKNGWKRCRMQRRKGAAPTLSFQFDEL